MAGVAGCARDVVLEAAPSASDPVCAQVLRTAPGALGGAESRPTTSQASLAWGTPPITLRCGVAPLAPTEERCIAVTGADGVETDWVVHEYDNVNDGDPARADRGHFAFTTYGRVPAVEVVVPVEYAGTDATAILIDLGPALQHTERVRQCWALSDLELPTDEPAQS